MIFKVMLKGLKVPEFVGCLSDLLSVSEHFCPCFHLLVYQKVEMLPLEVKKIQMVTLFSVNPFHHPAKTVSVDSLSLG